MARKQRVCDTQTHMRQRWCADVEAACGARVSPRIITDDHEAVTCPRCRASVTWQASRMVAEREARNV